MAVAVGLVLLRPGPAPRAAGVTREDAIAELQSVRVSIDETLALFKAGHDAEALEKARSGYLNHFEAVEIPLRVVDPSLTVEAESLFAEVRQLVQSDAPASEVRAKVVELRGVIDDVERRLDLGQRRRRRPSSPGSRSSSSSARASRSCCSCRCCSATWSRPRPATSAGRC